MSVILLFVNVILGVLLNLTAKIYYLKIAFVL